VEREAVIIAVRHEGGDPQFLNRQVQTHE